jgi:hypothetical protein
VRKERYRFTHSLDEVRNLLYVPAPLVTGSTRVPIVQGARGATELVGVIFAIDVVVGVWYYN